jgi:hypothetical protein
MSTFCEVANDDLIREKIRSRLNATLEQEMEIVDIATLLASPRVVRISGVPNPSGAVLSKIKDGMRMRCKSEIFRDALNAGMEDDIKANLKGVIQSVVIDANILELLGQCLQKHVHLLLLIGLIEMNW